MAIMEEILTKKVGMPAVGKKLTSLWMEYEKQETFEAKFVKDLDKFDMILQADEYERRYNMTLHSFFGSTQGVFQTPQVQRWDKYLRSQRDLRLSQKPIDDPEKNVKKDE